MAEHMHGSGGLSVEVDFTPVFLAGAGALALDLDPHLVELDAALSGAGGLEVEAGVLHLLTSLLEEAQDRLMVGVGGLEVDAGVLHLYNPVLADLVAAEGFGGLEVEVNDASVLRTITLRARGGLSAPEDGQIYTTTQHPCFSPF